MSVSRECTTEAIVLTRAPAGEGSARVLLYTKALGLVSALAKSAREERSKLRAHLQAGTEGTFRLVKGRDVWRITGISATQDAYFSLAEKKRSQEAAARVLSGIRQFVRGEGADEIVFENIAAFFGALRAMPEEYAADAECVAVLKLLAALGHLRMNGDMESFVCSPFDAEALLRARSARPVLLRAINEAVRESGL